jgi:iron complex outermembrane receptor protein
LVPRRTAEDQFIGINAGKTQHDGLELAINYKWLDQEKISISLFLNYTLNNYIFKEFIDDTKDFSGNELTGVPSDIFNTGLDFQTLVGFYGNINYQFVSSMPIMDSNSLYSDSYNLVNLKIGYQTNLTKKLKLNTFVGVNNVLDEFYASQILINATSFGGSAPRYYYPGNPVNYYVGINLNYHF